MPSTMHNIILLAGLSACTLSLANAQTAKVGPKQVTTQTESSEGSEVDHMLHLITMLKAEIPKIQDPAAKKAAADNLDLWQHMVDRVVRENQNANNTGAEHHHADDPAPAEMKQSPKPQ